MINHIYILSIINNHVHHYRTGESLSIPPFDFRNLVLPNTIHIHVFVSPQMIPSDPFFVSRPHNQRNHHAHSECPQRPQPPST